MGGGGVAVNGFGPEGRASGEEVLGRVNGHLVKIKAGGGAAGGEGGCSVSADRKRPARGGATPLRSCGTP